MITRWHIVRKHGISICPNTSSAFLFILSVAILSNQHLKTKEGELVKRKIQLEKRTAEIYDVIGEIFRIQIMIKRERDTAHQCARLSSRTMSREQKRMFWGVENMKLGTTYICVSDMQQSLAFYKALLQKEPLSANEDRWVTFDCGNKLSLYNKHYDERIIGKVADEHYNQAYINDFYMNRGQAKNNIVIFNFEVDDLRQEYERLRRLNIGKLSEIMYVNIHMPYWYFNIEDPDGNILEITGRYEVNS